MIKVTLLDDLSSDFAFEKVAGPTYTGVITWRVFG